MSNDLKTRALAYHAEPRPGKLTVNLTKPANTADDLTLAYSPGVAEPVRAIGDDAECAYRYTNKGNLVAVISNGSAILGLGSLGALASKPVMEGKGVLFKVFADIDVFDIEVDCTDVDEFVRTVKNISGTFGGINLEDIKAPGCFEIERRLIEECDIPVFHDDQHGTAIICTAGLLNALDIQGKAIEDVTIVCNGAGAAAISSLRMLLAAGAKQENILLCDSRGVVHAGRDNLSLEKQAFVRDTPLRTLQDALRGADVLLGLSRAGAVSQDMVAAMADRPIIFAMANPDPEIRPEAARAVRQDLIMATGRSDYPNQINNVLGFPFIFRGALDVRARVINEAMKMACALALRDAAHLPVPQAVLDAYGLDHLEFGPDYIVPKPFDQRLKTLVSAAVAKAAVDTGVAGAPYPAHYPPLR